MKPSSKQPIGKALFILDYPLSEWKGTQRTIYEFANYLYNLGVGVTLLENNKESGYGLNSNINVPFKLISYEFNFRGKNKKLRSIIKAEQPDVIYTANIINPFIPTFGTKTIFGMHSMNVSAIPFMNYKAKIKFYITQLVLSIFSLIFWNGKAVMFQAENTDQVNWVKKVYFNRIKATFVGSPVECISDDERAMLKRNHKNKKFTVLFFGALDRERGFEYFLEVIGLMKSNEENMQFTIAGNGTMKDFAEKAEQNFSNVTYIHNPSEKEKNDIMINSDIFVFPSWIENYSVTTVEAQLRGLPAIVMDCAPLRNIVENEKTGNLISEPNLIDKIIEKINMYYQIWENNYESYIQMRLNICELTTRLCKDRILPEFYKMLEGFLNNP